MADDAKGREDREYSNRTWLASKGKKKNRDPDLSLRVGGKEERRKVNLQSEEFEDGGGSGKKKKDDRRRERAKVASCLISTKEEIMTQPLFCSTVEDDICWSEIGRTRKKRLWQGRLTRAD